MSTIKAPLAQVARFLAHYIDLGAHRIQVHLDDPNPALAERLSHPKVRFYQCDDAYWEGRPNRARASHQMRQAFNATRVYRFTQLDWLAHFDVDEYLLPPAPLNTLLAPVDPSASHVTLPLVELMDSPGEPRHFKRAGSPDAIAQIYPTYGPHVPGGFISTLSPKIIARTGIPDVRLGIHALRRGQQIVRGGTVVPGLHLGHAHAPDFETFQRHMAYRLDKGSYHDRKGHANPLGHLIRVLMDDPNPHALRDFHTEMCVASPERLDLLAAHDMLVTARLDLDAKVTRIFGKLED
ncbi:MAG: glycosyltransferase family 2 protein [Pseudomonadota bacterium]